MKSIVTTTSRIKAPDGTLADGKLIIQPTAAFEYTDTNGVHVVQSKVTVDIVDGQLDSALSLAPCQGASVAPANVTYKVIYQFDGVSETAYWVIDESDPSSQEITAVTLGSVADVPTYQVLTELDATNVTYNATTVQEQLAANTAAAAAAQADIDAHEADTSNPHSVTASQVGLGNVDNTADADKPVSTAQAAALAAKQDTSEKGQADGYASLGADGLVPVAQLPEEVLMFALSDEATALAAATGVLSWTMPFAFTLTKVRLGLGTTSSSGAVEVDVKEAGTSVFGTKPQVAAGALYGESTTFGNAGPALADHAAMTADITLAGSSAKGLKLYLYGRRS